MKHNILALLVMFSLSAYAGSPQGVPVMTKSTVGTADSIPLAANLNRGYLLIQNQGNTTCLVAFGVSSLASTGGVQLGAGQYYEPVEAYMKSAVHMSCSLSGQTIQFIETNW
jgi:hypothetical protein